MPTTTLADNLYRVSYKSLGEFFKETEDTNPPSDIHSDNVSDFNEVSSDVDSSWRYGKEVNLSSYLQRRFDPSKGKNLCETSIKNITSQKAYKSLVTQALTYKKRVSFKETGGRISVSRAIAGEDTYFITQKNASKPTVKIGINMCVSASVDDDKLVEIATKAIPTIYALEMAGICTEVWLVAASSDTFYNSGFSHTLIEVRIKSAQERFNWTTFAPVFTTGTYRHGVFLTWLRQPHEISSGYGRPMSESNIDHFKSFGYTSIIGNNAPGPISQISTVFNKIKR